MSTVKRTFLTPILIFGIVSSIYLAGYIIVSIGDLVPELIAGIRSNETVERIFICFYAAAGFILYMVSFIPILLGKFIPKLIPAFIGTGAMTYIFTTNLNYACAFPGEAANWIRLLVSLGGLACGVLYCASCAKSEHIHKQLTPEHTFWLSLALTIVKLIEIASRVQMIIAEFEPAYIFELAVLSTFALLNVFTMIKAKKGEGSKHMKIHLSAEVSFLIFDIVGYLAGLEYFIA